MSGRADGMFTALNVDILLPRMNSGNLGPHRRILLPLKPLTKHEATKSGFRTRPPQKQLENERW